MKDSQRKDCERQGAKLTGGYGRRGGIRFDGNNVTLLLHVNHGENDTVEMMIFCSGWSGTAFTLVHLHVGKPGKHTAAALPIIGTTRDPETDLKKIKDCKDRSGLPFDPHRKYVGHKFDKDMLRLQYFSQIWGKKRQIIIVKCSEWNGTHWTIITTSSV